MQERVACVFVKNKVPLNAFAEACHRFSPQIAIREDQAVFLEIGGSLNLFSERTFFTRLSLLAQRFEITPHIGFGNDAPSALAMARFGYTDLKKLPLESLFDFASPFQYDEILLKKIERIVIALRKLGLQTLSEFHELPPRTLASRFGVEGSNLSLRIQQSFAAKLALPWPRFRMPEKIEEVAELHDSAEFGPCITLEPLLFIVKNLSDRAMARLRGRGLRVAALELDIELDHYCAKAEQLRLWQIALPTPQGSTLGLLPILRDRLNFDLARQPFAAPVMRAALRITETAPGHRMQEDLFNSDNSVNEAWDALVGRLCQKLGPDQAFLARPVNRYLPEKAWTRVLDKSAQSALTLELLETPERPARVLNFPKLLKRQGNRFYLENKAWTIIEWHGPERLSGEWWSALPLDRDYYRVVADNGEQLWVYSNPGTPNSSHEFYLHGYFD